MSVYENQAVRIADLTVTTDVIHDAVFKNCMLFGPAVLVLRGNTTIVGSTYIGDPDAMFWEILGQAAVMGAVALDDCTLVGCGFQRVGFGGTIDQVAEIRAGFGLG